MINIPIDIMDKRIQNCFEIMLLLLSKIDKDKRGQEFIIKD